MSTDVSIRVTGEAVSGLSAVNTTRKSLKELGETAKVTKTRVVDLALGEELAGRKSVEFARDLDKVGDESGQLARKLLVATAASRALTQEFAKTGDMDTLKRLELVNGELTKLKNVAKNVQVGDGKSNLFDSLFKSAAPVIAKAGKEGASTFASAFEGGIMETFKGLPPEAQAAIGASIAAAVVVAMPGIVAIINGALLLGVGAGGLAAGIAIAAKDPEVKYAFASLGHTIGDELKDAAKPFKAELIATSSIFDDAFSDAAPRIKTIFTGLAGAVQPLAHGIADAFTNALPGLEHAAKAALPILLQVAHELPAIGKVAGEMFDAIADAGPGAELAIKFILVSVEALIKAFTWLTEALGPVANGVAVLTSGAANLMDKLGGGKDLEATATALDHAGSQASKAGDSFDDMSADIERSKKIVDDLNKSFNDFFDIAMGTAQANLQVAESLTQLTEGFKQNGKTIKENTKEGQANLENIFSTVDAYKEQRDAAIAAGDGTKGAMDKANSAYNQQIANLEKMLGKLLGSKQAAHDLMAQFYDKEFTITARVRVIQTGPVSAQGVVSTGDLRRAVGKAYASGGIVGAAAAGGMRDNLVWTGEEGPELVSLPPGSQVHPAGESRRMMQQGTGQRGGGFTLSWDNRGTGGDDLAQLVQKYLRIGRIKVPRSALV